MPDKTLFKGAAKLYPKYRPAYPKQLIDIIKKYTHLNNRAKLLDIGCGPGHLTIPLSKHCRKVLAVDIDKDMLLEGKRQAKKAKVKNIKWLDSSAENLRLKSRNFDVVSFSNSLHLMNKKKVLRLVHKILAKDGYLIITTGHGWWNYKTGWQKYVVDVIKKHLGERRRAGKGFFQKLDHKYENLLPKFNFKVVLKKDVPIPKYTMTIEDITNYLYTTSFATKHLFKSKHKAFEKDLRNMLIKLNPKGKFVEKNYFTLIIAKKT